MDLVTPAVALGLGYVGLRAVGVIKPAAATPGAPAVPGAAPVPAAQTAAVASGAAPAIPGHVIPVPPEPSSGDPYAFLHRIPLPPGYSTDFLPRVQQGTGLWTDGTGRPYQFPDPNTGAPLGVAGYMPIEYAAHLAATHTAGDDVGNDSSSSSSSGSSSGGGGLPPWAGGALAAGGAVAAAVASGSGAAAAVGAAAAAALAALGPVPGVGGRALGERACWTQTSVETLVVEHDGRVLGVNVVRTPGGWSAVGIETGADAARAHGPPGLSAMYADHAHVVVGVYPTNHEARAAAVAYGETWLAARAACQAHDGRDVKCACPEIVVPA